MLLLSPKKRKMATVELTSGDGTSIIVKEDEIAKASEMIAARLSFPGRDDKEKVTLPEIHSGRVLKLVAAFTTDNDSQEVRSELEKADWNLLDETAEAADYLVMSPLLDLVAEIFVSKARSMAPPALKIINE